MFVTKEKIIKPSVSTTVGQEMFLQGAVYLWCKIKPNEWFFARDLVGSDWRGTPLQDIYEEHLKNGKTHDEAFAISAVDVGKLLKKVIANDLRTFETKVERNRKYRWVK